MREGYVEKHEDIGFEDSPVEDYSRTAVVYELPNGDVGMAEVSNSWSYVGPGLRHTIQLMGPEYSMGIDTLNSELEVFFSREVEGEKGEDLVEKQAAEQGLMPVVPDETVTYGYRDENQHMVRCFLDGEMPDETWDDGLFITKILMSLYMSAEKNKKLEFPPKGLEEFVPKVAKGTWKPDSVKDGYSE